jgi:RNA polymerase sigma-70 factor (ECF subfamily)
VKDGDASAATALYRRARPQVEKTLLRALGRRDRDHEDLVQLSMIELVRSIPSFRGECSLDTWTARITTRCAYKQLRRRAVERRVFDAEAEGDEVADDASGPESTVGARALTRRVRRHLDSMDPVKAWTVVLHDICGHDLREISEITECSVSAAQSRLVRGRADLHERISEDPDLADELRRREGRS